MSRITKTLLLPLRALPALLIAAALVGVVSGPFRAAGFLNENPQYLPLALLAGLALHVLSGRLYAWQVRRIMMRRNSELSPEVTGEVRGRPGARGTTPAADRPPLVFHRHGRDAVALTDRPEEHWLTDRLMNRSGRVLGWFVLAAWLTGCLTTQLIAEHTSWHPAVLFAPYATVLLVMAVIQTATAGFRPPSAVILGLLANCICLVPVYSGEAEGEDLLWNLAPTAAWLGVILAGLLVSQLGRVRQPPGITAPRLLLLRTFGLQGHTTTLFGQLARRWALLGPSATIADPTLAAHQFHKVRLWLLAAAASAGLFAVLGDRLLDGTDTEAMTPEARGLILAGYPILLVGAFLIASMRLAASAPQNLAAVEHRLSLDTRGSMAARFPVITLSCYDDRWQETVDQLLDWCDVVLMDARGFTEEKAGVAYELGVVLAGFPLDRTVFLVDASTDEDYLQQTMRTAWLALPSEVRPPTVEPTVHLYAAKASGRQFRRETKALVALLAEVTATAPRKPAESGARAALGWRALAAAPWLLGGYGLWIGRAEIAWLGLTEGSAWLLGAAAITWLIGARARVAMSVEGDIKRFFASPTWNVSLLTATALIVLAGQAALSGG